MKLFGKKTLALLLALSMVMSVCVFAEGETPEPIAVTGVTLNKTSLTLEVGQSETLNATVAPEDAANKAVTWSSSDSAVASVTEGGTVEAKKAGTTTITVTTTDGGKKATCDVTVKMNSNAKMQTVTAEKGSVDVPYNATAAFAANALESVKLTITYDQGVDVKTADWVLKSGVTYDSTKTGQSFAFVPNITVPEGVQLPEVNATIVKAKLASASSDEIGTVTVLLGVHESDLELPETVSLALNNAKAASFSVGGSNSYFDAWTSSTYNDDKVGSYTFTAKWKGGNANYDLSDISLIVKVVDSDFDLTASYDGKSLKDTAESIAAIIKGMYDDTVEGIEIDDMEMDGGDLYLVDEDGYMEEVDLNEYDLDDFADMVYYPNGNGENSYIDYIAYTDNDNDEPVRGTIVFEASPFMLITAEMTTDDILELDAAAFEDAFLNMDEDYDFLEFITISSPGNSKTKGYFYFDYDADDEKGEKVTASTKLYYDEDDVEKNNETYIDNVVYVPGSSMKSGTYEFQFKATGEDEDGKAVKNKVGYLRVILTESADITIQAGKGQEVALDYDLFEEYFEDNVSSTYDDYIITAVVFNGVPHSKNAGYLYLDDEKLTDPDGDKFWFDPDDEDEEDLFDLLTYVGGNKDTTTRGEFAIYGKKNANAKDSTSKKLVSGTIDFVTGAAAAGNTMNGTIRAAETMSFGESVTLNAFEELGGNNNEYIVFTSLPVGGKLVYNWGKSNQEDVKVGTEYWLSNKSGKKLMSNVTFVPSYSSSKVQKTVTIGVKGYNAKDRATTGTINITINYAAYSSKFYDITTSTYADSVDFLANQGITTGMTATTFGPNNNVTRAQFVTFLWRAAGSPSVTGVTNKFTDVKSTGTYAYAYQAILWAVQNNITTGRTATTFAPAANVTHQELLTFLYRYDVNYLKHSGTTSSYVSYTDYSSVSSYAQVPVKWADYKGILSGYTIQPTVAGTRATVALWLHRMLTL